jgi:uncharacterized membrane-anchored protein
MVETSTLILVAQVAVLPWLSVTVSITVLTPTSVQPNVYLLRLSVIGPQLSVEPLFIWLAKIVACPVTHLK